MKLQEFGITVTELLTKELVGSVAEGEGDDEATMKTVNYGRIFELYFAQLSKDNDSCQLSGQDNSQGPVCVQCSTVCSGAALLPLLARFVHIDEVLAAVLKMPGLADQLEAAKGPVDGEKLLGSTQLQNLVVAVQILAHCYFLAV